MDMVGGSHPRYNGLDIAEALAFGVGQWKSQGPDNSTTTPAINTLYLGFLMLPRSGVQLDAIAYPVNSAGVAGSVTRLGLYDDDGTGVRPLGVPLIDAGTIAGDSAGNKSIVFGAPVTVKYSKVWTASVVQTGAGGSARRWTGALQAPFYVADLTSLFSSSNNSQGWSMALAAGAALPNILAGTVLGQVNQGPMVAVRRYA
jgi:hypothetical protein